MLKHGGAYVDAGQNYYKVRYRSRVVQNLKRKAKELGYQLVEISGAQQKNNNNLISGTYAEVT